MKNMADFDNIAIGVALFCAAILIVSLGVLFLNIQTGLESTIRGLDDNSTVEGSLEVLGSINEVVDKSDTLFVALFIGLTISIIVTGFFIGGHPILAFMYFLFIIIGVVVSMILRWAYETLVLETHFAAAVTHLSGMNFIMTNLPYLVGVIGVLGCIAFFSRPYNEGAY